VPVHDDEVVFEVLSNLQHRAVLEQRLERGERVTDRDLALDLAAAEQVVGAGLMGERHVSGAAGRGGE
jgi:hypothetical protein